MTRNLGYFAIPQAWFSAGDAEPVRDLKRDLERVNRGEPFIEDRRANRFLHRIETYV
jgi:hypothetical protein